MAEVVAATAAAVGTVSQSKTAFWDPISTRIALSNDMKQINEKLKYEMNRLGAKRDDHMQTLHRWKATNTCKNWINRVAEVEDEVKEINSKYETKSRISFINFLLRSKFSKKMKNKILEVGKLLEEGTQSPEFFVEKDPEPVVTMIAPDIKDFKKLQGALEQILGFLTNKEVKGIRVHGMVGIGKTTIMQNLNNHEKVAEMFDIVIWVNASKEENNKNVSIEQMQQTIVRRLKLDIEGSDDVYVAGKIKEGLKDKKYLLLLDDVREDFKLDKIGIYPNNENGSKIVLTTTVGRVCNSIVDRVIKVETLSLDEALKMFENVVGNSIDVNNPEYPEFKRVMVLIVKYCGGLPLVLKTVASAFKMRKTVQRWSDGLSTLRQWPEKKDDCMKEMYKLLNFCCNDLDSCQKDCFFYSAMYPEDSDIHTDYLLDCWAAEDLYGSANDAEQVRVSCRDILAYLKTVSLLEECVQREYVRMHKLIRQAALYNLSADDKRKHLVKSGESLQEPPNVEHWKHKNWISLVGNKLHTLPEHPDCSMLSTLLLQENPALERLPDLFFEHMENLRVLNLYCTGIVSLPPSILKLVRLKVLYLNDCTGLVELPSQIEKLEHLEVLDIRGSGVENLPSNIEKLNRLKRLLVSFSNIEKLDSNIGNKIDTRDVSYKCSVISKISTLEELVVDVKSDQQCCNEILNAVASKVAATLTKLVTLKFCFEDGFEYDAMKMVAGTLIFNVPKAETLISFAWRIDDLHSKSFQVFVGCSISSTQIPDFYQYQRYLRFCGGEDSSNPTICQVLAKADAFELVNHNDLTHVSVFGSASMDGVRGCVIEGCNEITTIVGGTVDCPIILPNLEQLYIKKLPKLESIWKCPMKARSLSRLMTLDIRDCYGIEELFTETGNDILLNLRELILIDVPNIIRICKYGSFEWPALEKLHIHGCPSLTELPFKEDNATTLKSIEADRTWWERLQWQDQEVKKRLSALCCLG